MNIETEAARLGYEKISEALSVALARPGHFGDPPGRYFSADIDHAKGSYGAAIHDLIVQMAAWRDGSVGSQANMIWHEGLGLERGASFGERFRCCVAFVPVEHPRRVGQAVSIAYDDGARAYGKIRELDGGLFRVTLDDGSSDTFSLDAPNVQPVVVDLRGQPIDPGNPPTEGPLAVLKGIVAKIEAGELELEWVYVLGASPDPDVRGDIVPRSFDSGLTVAHAVYELEREKAHIIRMATGDRRDA